MNFYGIELYDTLIKHIKWTKREVIMPNIRKMCNPDKKIVFLTEITDKLCIAVSITDKYVLAYNPSLLDPSLLDNEYLNEEKIYYLLSNPSVLDTDEINYRDRALYEFIHSCIYERSENKKCSTVISEMYKYLETFNVFPKRPGIKKENDLEDTMTKLYSSIKWQNTSSYNDIGVFTNSLAIIINKNAIQLRESVNGIFIDGEILILIPHDKHENEDSVSYKIRGMHKIFDYVLDHEEETLCQFIIDEVKQFFGDLHLASFKKFYEEMHPKLKEDN